MFIGCVQEPPNVGKKSNYGIQSIYCLRDGLINEDNGGTWTQLNIGSAPADLTTELTGDNPCIEFDNYPCGSYEFQYKVQNQCCADSTTINILKPCCTAIVNITCN